MVAAQGGQGPHRDRRPLQRLYPADEEEQRALLGKVEGAAGLLAVAGTEERMIDPGGHDADPGRVGAVQLVDLRRLHRAGGEHGVGAADDGGLGLGPMVRGVCLDLFGAGLGLHPVEGMEGRDEGQVHLVLDGVAGDAAQPVVGVHGVEGEVLIGAEALRRVHALEHAVGELLDHPGKHLLGDGCRRAGGDVVDTEPGLDAEGGGKVVRPRPGEDIADHPGPGQGRRELADVDVHAAAVPRSGLGQGRGVQRKDGQTPHAPPILPGGLDQPVTAAESPPDPVVVGPACSPVVGVCRCCSPGCRPHGRRSRGGTTGRCASTPGAGPR